MLELYKQHFFFFQFGVSQFPFNFIIWRRAARILFKNSPFVFCDRNEVKLV